MTLGHGDSLLIDKDFKESDRDMLEFLGDESINGFFCGKLVPHWLSLAFQIGASQGTLAIFSCVPFLPCLFPTFP